MERMTAGDAAWYRMDRPLNETDILGLLTLAGPVDLDRVQHVVEDRLVRVERFRHRPVPQWAGAPGWEPDPGFAVRRHVSRVRIPAGGLPELLGEVTSSRLDPAHPLWRLLLVEEPGGEATIVAKLHHALGDGFALIALLLSIADEPIADAAPAPRQVAGTGPGLFPGLAALAAVRDAISYAATLVRLAALPYDPPELAATPLSGIRRVAWSRAFPLEAVRAAAHAAGATVNDLLLAAIAGGVRSRLAADGKSVDRMPLRAYVPANLREGRPDLAVDASLGNRFGLLGARLPVDVSTPRARLEAVRAEMIARREGPDAVVAYDVLRACGIAPTLLHHAVTGFFARKGSLVVTNVPGPARPVHLGGHRISRLVFWVPHTASLGLGVSIISYAGEVRLGVRADRAAIPDPEDLVARIEAEVEALGVPPAAVRAVEQEPVRDLDRARG